MCSSDLGDLTRRLLHAAAEVFAEKGYEKAGVAEIARRAGVGAGTVYRHFPTKEALFTAVFEDRVATISFIAGDRDSKAIVDQVDPHMIGIRHGDFYAKRLIQDIGLAPQNGVVRVSMVHYNTLDEVDRLIAALEPAL